MVILSHLVGLSAGENCLVFLDGPYGKRRKIKDVDVSGGNGDDRYQNT